jgi:hypothetical protein
LRLALVREAARDWAGAERAFRSAAEAFLTTAPSNRLTPGHIEPAFARLHLATVLGQQGNWFEARQVLRESRASLEAVENLHGPEWEWLYRTCRELYDVDKKIDDAEGRSEASQLAAKYGVDKKDGFGWSGGGKKDGFGGKKDGPPPKKDGFGWPGGGPKKDGPPPKK